jgi:hypothetical protein
MSAVLTTSSSVTCSFQGKVQTSSAAKLRVNGSPVLIKSSIASKSISGCNHPVDSSKSIAKCLNVASLGGGFAGKLTAGGAAVALASLSGVGDSTSPTDTISASAGQSKLTAS